MCFDEFDTMNNYSIITFVAFGQKEKQDSQKTVLLHMLALPIFPGRLQPSIVGRTELNFRVRDGNGWTLDLINTNYFVFAP